jgi:hypothetical protein
MLVARRTVGQRVVGAGAGLARAQLLPQPSVLLEQQRRLLLQAREQTERLRERVGVDGRTDGVARVADERRRDRGLGGEVAQV